MKYHIIALIGNAEIKGTKVYDNRQEADSEAKRLQALADENDFKIVYVVRPSMDGHT